MTTLYSAEYQNAYVSEPSVLNDVTKLHGRVRCIKADITLAAELAIADVVKFAKLPKGARLLDARIVCPSDGTSGIYDIGWEVNDDEAVDLDGIFVGATSVDFGAGAIDAKMVATVAGFGKKFAAETVISGVVTEASTAATGDTHELLLFYTLD